MQPLYRSNKPLVKRITLLVLHMVHATAPEWFEYLPFRGYLSLTHFGAPMGSQAKVAKFRPFLRQILTFLTPHPANQVNFSLSKMAFRGVSHTVLQVLCSTGTSGGSLRPPKGQKWPKNHFLGHFWVCFVWFRKFSRIPIEKREKCRLRKSCSSFGSPDTIKAARQILLSPPL